MCSTAKWEAGDLEVLTRARRRLDRLRSSAYASDIRTVATAAVISQALLLAATPALTRLYTPADFGILAIFISILGLAPIVATFRYDIAISLSKDRQESFQTLTLCLFSTVFCAVAVAVLFASPLLSGTSLGEMRGYWWLIGVGTFAVGSFTALNAWAGYAQKFKVVARVKIRQALSSVVTQLLFGVLTVGPLGLLVGYVMSQSYGASAFILEIKRSQPKRFRITDLAVVARKYRHFFYFAFPAGVINRLGIHIIPVLVGSFYTISAAGFFLLAQRLVALPTLVVGRAVAQVYTNKLAKDSLADGVKLFPTYIRTVAALLAVGFIPMSLLAAFSPWLFEVIFGEDWRTAGVFCQLLVPAFYAQFAVAPMMQTLNVLGYQRLQLVWDTLRLGAIFAVFATSQFYKLSEQGAVGLVSATLFSAYILQFLLSVIAIKRRDERRDGDIT